MKGLIVMGSRQGCSPESAISMITMGENQTVMQL